MNAKIIKSELFAAFKAANKGARYTRTSKGNFYISLPNGENIKCPEAVWDTEKKKLETPVTQILTVSDLETGECWRIGSIRESVFEDLGAI